MHKVYIVTTNQFINNHLTDLGLINIPRPRPRPDRGHLTPRQQTPNQAPEIMELNVQLFCNLYLSKQEALDAINEFSRHNLNAKWYLFESIVFVEVPPTQPIIKQWNNDGELHRADV